MKRFGLLLASMLVAGCAAPSGEQKGVDAEAERRALLAADAAWYESHKDMGEFLTFLDADAAFMPEGAPMARGEEIRSTWEALLTLPGFELQWQATEARVGHSGDLGYTLGTYRLTVEQDGSPLITTGKYVTIWTKQSDGAWKVAVDCFNSDGPPAKS